METQNINQEENTKVFELWEQTEIIGCEMGDGADTRQTVSKFLLIPVNTEQEREEFGDFLVSCYENQDYSYKVDFKKLALVDTDDLIKLKELIEKVIN